jgi:Tfp pilus assembly protein PilO
MKTGDFKLQKNLALGGLGLLIVADVLLASYSVHLASTPQTPKEVLAVYTRQRDLLARDVQRAEDIRAALPSIQETYDKFEDSLPSSQMGYSVVSQELGEIARQCGLRIEGITYKSSGMQGRELTAVDAQAAVSGDYASVVKFLNGLQRSQHVYAVTALTLSPADADKGSNTIRVALQMRTYFRAGT